MLRPAALRLARRALSRSTVQRAQAMHLHVAAKAASRRLPRAMQSLDVLSMAMMSTDAKADRHEFQAETRQLLDIVTHSIYTDKEVFIRELISNASDALEKLRHLQATGESVENPELEPQIVITTDENANTLTIADTGIGMTKSELVENLGTIARSGSKAFLEQIKDKAPGASGDALSGIIGKFGVGFYSAFMVADKVEVFTQSAVSGSQSHLWSSDGSGSYEVAPASDVTRGSKIVIHLKDSCKDYAKAHRVESIIRQYSNFVSFPIMLNGETVNTVQALWTKSESDVTDEEYNEFYKFIANAFDDPMYRIIFKADAPLEMKTLFFIGSTHTEKFGYARLEPGVSLYSRKSSQLDANSLTTLDEYVSRCPPDQNEIYYLCAPSRAIAEASPYFEAFKKTKKEVLFVYHPIDDFVMTNVAEFNGRKVISAEHAKLDVEDDDDSSKKLTEEQQRLFGAWIKLTLEDTVKEVKFTSRLTESPAVISDHESASIRKMMSIVNDRTGQSMASAMKHVLEVNPRHRIIVDLNTLRETNKPLAEKIAKQIYTNATVAAGLVEDGRSLLGGLNEILGELLEASLATHDETK
ncbi:hypothetical protein P43SY_004864 [Pythium insidiosum]|uniref:Heat shock protein 75 kDa, mitochondrial n=1 Tax=Pythium insidiosum TaxID=114742 RepID=A0AAD5LYY7_PYTIN|nr:hypothetical protein P43SY_004864 [Pythium insidiosum]